MKNRISEWRNRRKMTVEQLAEAADTSPGQISKLQNGKARLDTDWLERLSKALGCRILDLVSDSLPPDELKVLEKYRGYSESKKPKFLQMMELFEDKNDKDK